MTTRHIIVAAVLLAAALPVTVALASETYEKATGLKCQQCHKQTKAEFEKKKIVGLEATQDMLKCGKESLAFLKTQPGFRELKEKDELRTEAEARKWALALVRGRWKCSLQAAPGKPIKL